MSLDAFETAEIKAGFDLLAKDERLTEEVVQRASELVKIGLTEDEIHDVFILFGGTKGGFTQENWLKAFKHKDHGDADEEVTKAFNGVSEGGRLDWGKVTTLLKLNGRVIPDEVLETLQGVCDYNNDGAVDMDDFVKMIHAE